MQHISIWQNQYGQRACHYEHDWQRKRTKYTVPQVDKGTSLNCYNVKMCRTGVTCIFTFLHNSSEGIFLCLPEELYILSAFFVCHVQSPAWQYVLYQGFLTPGFLPPRCQKGYWVGCEYHRGWIGMCMPVNSWLAGMHCTLHNHTGIPRLYALLSVSL